MNSRGSCNALYPAYTFPRFVAGMSLANDVVACHLRPINVEEHAVEWTSGDRTA